MLIDTHCHVDQYKNPNQIICDCVKYQILTIGVTNLPSHYLIGKEHVLDNYFFKLAIGFHPLAIEQAHYKMELEIFQQHVSQCDYIGEIGLDFSQKNKICRKVQIDVFCQILCSIGVNKKIVTIHSRGAEKEVLEILIEKHTCPVVLHWYSGPLSYIDQFLAAGHYFSVNPSMTQTAKGRAFIAKVPRNRILTETDGPYVKITGNPVMPQGIRAALRGLASLWNMNEDEVQQHIQSNFEKITGTSGTKNECAAALM